MEFYHVWLTFGAMVPIGVGHREYRRVLGAHIVITAPVTAPQPPPRAIGTAAVPMWRARWSLVVERILL
jgi:hypothetical protein